MKSPFSKKPASELTSWRQLLEQADLCAFHAADAANCGRFCAACGLILTADALCRRALESPSAKKERLSVENEVASRRGFYQDEVDRLLEKAVTARLGKS